MVLDFSRHSFVPGQAYEAVKQEAVQVCSRDPHRRSLLDLRSVAAVAQAMPASLALRLAELR